MYSAHNLHRSDLFDDEEDNGGSSSIDELIECDVMLVKYPFTARHSRELTITPGEELAVIETNGEEVKSLLRVSIY